MGKPNIPPPSKIDALPFPVFGLSWYGAPTNIGSEQPRNRGISALAYCGGGGSSKTGVLNKIVVVVTTEGERGSVTRQIDISTGEALCFGVHVFRPYNDEMGMVRLLACVGDELLLYGIPVESAPFVGGSDEQGEGQQQQQNEEAVLLGKVNVGQGYGASVTTYTLIHRDGVLHQCVAVGCENGVVVLYELKQEQQQQQGNAIHASIEFIKIAECTGHTKAVCSINFHPRGTEILSSAKDGSARIFCTQTGLQLGIMECEVHDPKDPPPLKPEPTSNVTTKDPRMMKRPPQILVRGCAYGDLEGKSIFTVASGKRGPAYLTKWKTLVPLASTMSPASSSSSSSPSSNRTLSIRQEYRIQCSPVPISATSLSSDGTLLALGSVEGSILLYNLETKSVLKQFQGHDLPVTCLASRPIPNALMLPGDLEGGVNYDAVSASADNRLGMWTLQRKSRIVAPKQQRRKREMNALESFLWSIVRIPLLLFVIVVLIAVHDVLDLCQEEVKLPALMADMGAAGHCVYREVLWAESSRPGVRSVPE